MKSFSICFLLSANVDASFTLILRAQFIKMVGTMEPQRGEEAVGVKLRGVATTFESQMPELMKNERCDFRS